MFYNWTSQRSALPASLQLDLKSDHRTMCPPLGEKEPYERSSPCCLMQALLGWGWEGWGVRWEGREIKERDKTADLLCPWLPRHRAVLASHWPPSASLSPLISPGVSMCRSPLLLCCPLPTLYVGGSPAPRASVAIRTLMTFKKVFSRR